jgi:hypothetical protein
MCSDGCYSSERRQFVLNSLLFVLTAHTGVWVESDAIKEHQAGIWAEPRRGWNGKFFGDSSKRMLSEMVRKEALMKNDTGKWPCSWSRREILVSTFQRARQASKLDLLSRQGSCRYSTSNSTERKRPARVVGGE